jgi:hypothetical protein
MKSLTITLKDDEIKELWDTLDFIRSVVKRGQPQSLSDDVDNEIIERVGRMEEILFGKESSSS